MTTLLMLLSTFVSAASPAAPQALCTINEKRITAQFADTILSAAEQKQQGATCGVYHAEDKTSCYWTGSKDDDRAWLVRSASFADIQIDRKTRVLTYTRDLAGRYRPGSHREARFTLDPVDLEDFAALPLSGYQYVRVPDAVRERLWALAQEAERRGEDVDPFARRP